MTIFQGILFLEIPSSDAFIFIFSLLATKVQLQDGGFSHTPSLLLAVDFYPLPGNLKPGRREEDLHSGSKICLLPHGTLWVLFFHSPVLECLVCLLSVARAGMYNTEKKQPFIIYVFTCPFWHMIL